MMFSLHRRRVVFWLNVFEGINHCLKKTAYENKTIKWLLLKHSSNAWLILYDEFRNSLNAHFREKKLQRPTDMLQVQHRPDFCSKKLRYFPTFICMLKRRAAMSSVGSAAQLFILRT